MSFPSSLRHPRIAVTAASLACCMSASAADVLALSQEVSRPETAAAVAAMIATWHVDMADGTLKAVLGRWAQTAGWQLVWEPQSDFRIEASADLAGGFEDAAGALILSAERSSVPVRAIFYRGNKVLRIVAKGGR
jgi:hypothetical protein